MSKYGRATASIRWLSQLRVGPQLLVVGSGARQIHWVAPADLARWAAVGLVGEAATGRTLTLQGRDALGFQEAARQLAAAAGLEVLELPIDAVHLPGAAPALVLVRKLHQLFTYLRDRGGLRG